MKAQPQSNFASLRSSFSTTPPSRARVVRHDGDADAGPQQLVKRVEAFTNFPRGSRHHGADDCTCTSGPTARSVDTHASAAVAQGVIARRSKLPPDPCCSHHSHGGGFAGAISGFRDGSSASGQGLRQAGHGILDREDDMQHGFYRPFLSSFRGRALTPRAAGRLETLPDFYFDRCDVESEGRENPEKSEFATAAFIPPPYQTPNYRIEYTLAKSSCRAPGGAPVEHSPAGFVVESLCRRACGGSAEAPMNS